MSKLSLRTYVRRECITFRRTAEAFGGLSNMAPGFPIEVNGISVRTSEALYQACRFPHRPEVQRLIVEQNSPMTAKMKSKPFRADSRADWERVRIAIMRWTLRVKLASNWSRFSELLLSTGTKAIVEDSRKDDFWGAIPTDNGTLVGVNALGRLLMEIREEIRHLGGSPLSAVHPLQIPNFLLFGQAISTVEAVRHGLRTVSVDWSRSSGAPERHDSTIRQNGIEERVFDRLDLSTTLPSKVALGTHRWDPMNPRAHESQVNRDDRFHAAFAAFGATVGPKLSNTAASGEPEDQLRAPLETLVCDIAELCGVKRDSLVVVGESSLADLKTRPDYAVAVDNALIGFIEVKAPGKGADPRKYKGHDKAQWEKLRSLPNLVYTDGVTFSLWRSGELQGTIVHLDGDFTGTGAPLRAPLTLLALFAEFFGWSPIPPRTARQLAETSARLCRLLRDEVTEQLAIRNPALTELATGWRKLLFPEATDSQFADGYAQAVTFGLLMARAREIDLETGLDRVSRQLGQTNSLIGAALRLLTDDAENRATLKTSLETLVRVLAVVDWRKISKGNADAWLYFYEDFLSVYDNELRKQTGSYYTPPEVVDTMVRLVDDALRSPKRFGRVAGLASSTVTIADPAVGTGTFLLGTLRRIAQTVAADEGEGSVPAAITAAANRLLGFEVQLGPFAVAQLRLLAELAELVKDVPAAVTPVASPRMFVTDTLGNPYMEEEWLDSMVKPIAESRRSANRIKIEEHITVVIGNPPYKEKTKGRGGWIESGSPTEAAPLADWIPPRSWGIGAHTKHLRNLYVYFWRWATWKVFDRESSANAGIVCFITVSGFLSGPGFQKMRDYLRRNADEIWVIDCSPEGHRPEVSTRIFESVQQPICIVLASRSPYADTAKPAAVRFRALPIGHRNEKFEALASLSLDSEGWVDCASDWRAPFAPESSGAWATYPALETFFIYNGSGVMPGRTWIIAPDAQTLHRRWNTLVSAAPEQQDALFHPHLVDGKPGDRHANRVVAKGLPGYDPNPIPVSRDKGSVRPPTGYAFRSFDRQWIIPDNRVINRPNPELWGNHSERQVYLTGLTRTFPTSGPALTFSGLVPDLDHYNGRGGRVFPLWRDRNAMSSNIAPALLTFLSDLFNNAVTAEDVLGYIAAVAAHPAFTARFQADLKLSGLVIPLTANRDLFLEGAALGRSVVWLHTFGERFTDPSNGRPAAPPRLAGERAPRVPATGAISQAPEEMPDMIDYDATNQRLQVGTGYIEPVSPEIWQYEVSGVPVLRHWFSYRKANRGRPIIGDRRVPSKLSDIQPDHWLAEYTTELLNLINVLGRLVELEPAQADLLDRVCTGSTIPADLLMARMYDGDRRPNKKNTDKAPPAQTNLLEW